MFRFLASNEEIELNLGGRVVLSVVNTAQIWRKIGIFVESGAINVLGFRVSEMHGTEIKIWGRSKYVGN